MKTALLGLLALVAATQAAFTANLVQEAQPVLAQGMFKIRLVSRSDTFHQEVAALIQSHANDILSQVQTTIATGHQIAVAVQSHLSEVIAQLQSQGEKSVTGVVLGVGGAIGGAILGGAQIINAAETVANVVSSAWNWLFGRNLGFLGNVADFVSGLSITDILTSLADYATGLINQLDLNSLLQHALALVIPKPIADLFGGELGLMRGFFGDLWGSVSNAASSAWDQISNVAGSVYEAAAQSFTSLQQLASNFASNAWTEATAISTEAAHQFLEFLKPYQQDMGTLYDQVVGQLNQLLGSRAF